MAKDYDLVVIGASPEGIAAARIAARWQARVALVSDGAWQPHGPDQVLRDRLRQGLSLEAALDPPPLDLMPLLLQEGIDVVDAAAQVRRRHWVIAGDRRLLTRHILHLPPHATPLRDALTRHPDHLLTVRGSGTLALESLWVLQQAGYPVSWLAPGQPLADWSEPSRQRILDRLAEAGLSPGDTLSSTPILDLPGEIPRRDLSHLTERLRQRLFGVRCALRPVPWRRLQLEQTYMEIGAIASTPSCATPELELFLSPRRGRLRGARLAGADADARAAVLAVAIARNQRLPTLAALLPEGAIAADPLQELADQWSRQRSLSGWRYQLLQEYFVFWRSTF
jgi:hypothetical protein